MQGEVALRRTAGEMSTLIFFKIHNTENAAFCSQTHMEISRDQKWTLLFEKMSDILSTSQSVCDSFYSLKNAWKNFFV